MAEIDVQKKSSNIWPWILGLLVLGIVIWMLVGRSDTDSMTGTPSDIPAAEQPTAPPATTENPATRPYPDTTPAGVGNTGGGTNMGTGSGTSSGTGTGAGTGSNGGATGAGTGY